MVGAQYIKLFLFENNIKGNEAKNKMVVKMKSVSSQIISINVNFVLCISQSAHLCYAVDRTFCFRVGR